MFTCRLIVVAVALVLVEGLAQADQARLCSPLADGLFVSPMPLGNHGSLRTVPDRWPRIQHPLYTGQKIYTLHPVYHGERVDMLLLNGKRFTAAAQSMGVLESSPAVGLIRDATGRSLGDGHTQNSWITDIVTNCRGLGADDGGDGSCMGGIFLLQ